MSYTLAQDDAIEKIKHLMREHFENGVLILSSLGEESNDMEEKIIIEYHGGFITAYGLVSTAKSKFDCETSGKLNHEEDDA